MAKSTEIEAMVKRSLEKFEFRRRGKDANSTLIRITGSGRVDILVDGRWRQTTRFRRPGTEDGWEVVKSKDLRRRARRFFLPDLDAEAKVPKPLHWRRRLRETRLWRWLQPPLNGGAPRHVTTGPVLKRCRADYRRELRRVDGAELVEIRVEIEDGYQRNRDRVASAEQRANVFLGASVLTSSLVLANAGLLIGSDHSLESPYLQIGAAALALASACAIVSAYRALQATMWTFGRMTPTNAKDVFGRRGLRGEKLTRNYLAAVFTATNRAATIADWKVAQMKSARRWILATALAIVVLTIVVLAEAV